MKKEIDPLAELAKMSKEDLAKRYAQLASYSDIPYVKDYLDTVAKYLYKASQK